MKRKSVIYIIAIAVLSLMVYSCYDMNDISEKYIVDGEIIYIAKVDSAKTYSGFNRVILSFVMGSDPKISEVLIYWNSKKDSLLVNIDKAVLQDTIMVPLNLPEKDYLFEIYTLDDKGNRSVKVPVVGKAYGESYRSTLTNRAIGSVAASPTSLAIKWAEPKEAAVMVEMEYHDAAGNIVALTVPSSETTTVLPSWEKGSEIKYRTFYNPEACLDTFSTDFLNYALPRDFLLDKSLFRIARLPGDVTGDNFGGNLTKLWNGIVANSDWYHTSPLDEKPQVFTIDLGCYATLSHIQLYPRQECCYEQKAKTYEIWGIADTTDAVPELLPSDSNWKSECLDKGWVMLLRDERSDPSEQNPSPIDMDIEENTPIRFLRYRVEEIWGTDNYVSLCEINLEATQSEPLSGGNHE